MTKQKTASGCEKENVVEDLHQVNSEDCEPKEKGTSEQEAELDSQPSVKPDSDIDDGGPLSI